MHCLAMLTLVTNNNNGSQQISNFKACYRLKAISADVQNQLGLDLYMNNIQYVDSDLLGWSNILHVAVKPTLMAFDPGNEGGERASGCNRSSHVNNGMHTVKCSMCVKCGHVPTCLHTNKQHA